MGAAIERIVTEGRINGLDEPISNNVWIVGDSQEVIVIDAAHDATPIIHAIGGRTVRAIIITHGHQDHVNVAPELRTETGAPIWLHPEDRFLWDSCHPGISTDGELRDGQVFEVAATRILVLHTPGHTPGAVSLAAPSLHCVFTGDTLFEHGPGATRHVYSSYPEIVRSIRDRLFPLPSETTVYTGHGPSTTIGAELGNVPEAAVRR